jgi:A/G-specific adenine glycosylase
MKKTHNTSEDKKQDVKKLSLWYEKNQRQLPWRKNRNPYFVWISEVMLQQTTVVTVIPYFERFIKNFPTPEKLAAAPLEEVLENWSGLGYYSRARNLHKSAQVISKKGFPESFSELIELPGFGPYTSRAVSSIAFDEAVGVLDGNVIRVLSRKYGIKKKWWENKIREEFQTVADEIISHGKSHILNQALMELGATICTPDKPLCTLCPWAKDCYAFSNDQVKQLPLKKPRKEMVLWAFTPHIVENKKDLLFVKGDSFPFLKKIWFLPGDIQKITTKPKEFLFKHSITNNYIYVLQAKRISSRQYKSSAKEMLWIPAESSSKHSPSSMTKKVLELSGLA